MQLLVIQSSLSSQTNLVDSQLSSSANQETSSAQPSLFLVREETTLSSLCHRSFRDSSPLSWWETLADFPSSGYQLVFRTL